MEVTRSFSQVFDYPSHCFTATQNQDVFICSYRQQYAPNPAEANLDQASQDSFRYGQVLDILEVARLIADHAELRQQMASLHKSMALTRSKWR